MIDLKFLRENPDIVKENIKKKFQDHKLPLVDEVIELDEQARSAQQEADPYCGCETINIDCKAHNCTYNEHCKCTAASINVSGDNAHRCCDTKCDTFSCKC